MIPQNAPPALAIVESQKPESHTICHLSPSAGWVSRISRWPVIVLAAKNSGQLSRLASEAAREALPFNCFTGAMIGGSAEEQIRQTRDDSEPEYWVVAVFGAAEELRPLTKRFSLFSANKDG